MKKPVSFKTQRGNRVFRLAYKYKGEVKHAENYNFRVKRRGKQSDFNLGLEKKEAGKLADEISAFLKVKGNTIQAAQEKYSLNFQANAPLPPVTSNLGVLLERYVKVTPHLRPITHRNNTGALRHIAAFILKLPRNPKRLTTTQLATWRSKTDSLELTELTPVQLERFQAAFIEKAKDDNISKGKAVTTSNFYLRCASSVFAKKLIKHYSDLTLPSPIPFSEFSKLAEPSHRYVSTINPSELVTSARDELKSDYPDSYLAFLLSFYCGMRRAEIDGLIWEQVDFVGHHIWIRTTDHFQPKAKNSESRIDAPEFVMAELKKFKQSTDSELFVFKGTKPKFPPRCRKLFRHLIDWLKSKGVKQTQALHTLRKEAGSLMFNQTSSIDKSADFLRNDPRVAREHYIGRKERLELSFGT